MRFRKKPITVEAFQMTRDVETIAQSWFMEAVLEGKVYINHSLVDGHALVYGCTIETPGGKIESPDRRLCGSRRGRRIISVQSRYFPENL